MLQREQCMLTRTGSFIPKEKGRVFFIGLNEGNGGLQIDWTMCLVVPGSQNEREGGVEVLVCLAVNVMLVT